MNTDEHGYFSTRWIDCNFSMRNLYVLTKHLCSSVFICGFALLYGALPASAQSWPTKPIKVIVPYPPGGTSDILARALGPGMQAALGQPWIVENKPGATGNVGADFVALRREIGRRQQRLGTGRGSVFICVHLWCRCGHLWFRLLPTLA